MPGPTEHFDMHAAPMRIGAVRLKVRDLDAVAGFYKSILGLAELETTTHRIILGTGTAPLLELAGDSGLALSDGRQAGLFHSAFLMPSRTDLARWLAHVAAARVPIQGASDHIVSEAIYLADPEGNGIEVYSDRPVANWRGPAGDTVMSTEPLDVQSLLKAADDSDWSGFPEAGMIGHVHLQVGDTAEADRFYRDVLGLEVAVRYPGASFYGSGGYHHHLAGNVWNSRGAGKRPENMSGLDAVDIIFRDATELGKIAARAERAGIEVSSGDSGMTLLDPWGTAIMLKS